MITNQSSLHFEQLNVGDQWTSQPREICLSDITKFADLTGDRDRLHVDPEFASRGPFGKPIAHGMLGMSILAGLSSTAPFVKTAALVDIRSWNFSRPLFPGDSVHVVTEVVALKAHGRRHGEVHWHRSLVNQKGEIVQDGILVTLVSRQSPLSTRSESDATDSNTTSNAGVPAQTGSSNHEPLLEGV